MSGPVRLSRSRLAKDPSPPAFSSGNRLSKQSESISTSDRRFGGKSGMVSISGPKVGKKKKR